MLHFLDDDELTCLETSQLFHPKVIVNPPPPLCEQAGPPPHGDPADEIRSRSLHRRRRRLPRSAPRHPLPAHGYSCLSNG